MTTSWSGGCARPRGRYPPTDPHGFHRDVATSASERAVPACRLATGSFHPCAGVAALADALGSGPLDGGTGPSHQQLSYLARTGSLQRVAQGLYRLHRFPAQRFEDVIVACLWAGDDAVASHDTVLTVYDLTDAMPAVIHVSTPRPFRGKRRDIVVHTAPLGDGERTERAGVPVTTGEAQRRLDPPTRRPPRR